LQQADVFGLTGADMIQWSPASDRLFLMEGERGEQEGTSRRGRCGHRKRARRSRRFQPDLPRERERCRLGNWRVVGDKLLWWSERDGWGHFYRYALDGMLEGQVTRGDWLAERIRWIDPVTKQLYFSALGRDPSHPHYVHLMRVNLDGTGLVDLTPEPGNHWAQIAPAGGAFVDVHSRLDQPPVTTLRSTRDGSRLLELEKGDPSQLLAAGWTPPRPFTVKARDGVTDLYGLLYLPSRFDTTKALPVIDHIYPGPQAGSIFAFDYPTEGEPRALAELGFAVVEVNSLGTPGRSKAFHDAYYGNMGDNGIPDHIAAIKQLGARYPFLDLNRVGSMASRAAAFRRPPTPSFATALRHSVRYDHRTRLHAAPGVRALVDYEPRAA
jgi:dipeptidyl aminopeptidase/acylaminoacyl peptidase